MTRNYQVKLIDVDGNLFYENSSEINQTGKPPGFSLVIEMVEITDPNIAPGDRIEIGDLQGKSYKVEIMYDLSHEEKINRETKVTSYSKFEMDIGTPL